jgi:hypothetical protein
MVVYSFLMLDYIHRYLKPHTHTHSIQFLVKIKTKTFKNQTKKKTKLNLVQFLEIIFKKKQIKTEKFFNSNLFFYLNPIVPLSNEIIQTINS